MYNCLSVSTCKDKLIDGGLDRLELWVCPQCANWRGGGEWVKTRPTDGMDKS